jgi:hypothetical protein
MDPRQREAKLSLEEVTQCLRLLFRGEIQELGGVQGRGRESRITVIESG